MVGFVISIPQKYEEQAIKCIKRLRTKFKLNNPIEIWETGSEISQKAREELSTINNIIFRNVLEFTQNLEQWRGYQIKAFAALNTSFREFILCDADIMFCQNPLIILEDERYKKTGTYFFRDLMWRFKSDKSESYIKCQTWLNSLFPSPPSYFPKEWLHFFAENNSNIIRKGLCKEYMEAGVMYFNRNKIQDVLDEVYKLNENHKETYKYIHGDKDTWWIACCLKNKEYAMNNSIPIYFPPLTHFYKLRPFFYQKEINIINTIYYWLKTPVRLFKYSRTI